MKALRCWPGCLAVIDSSPQPGMAFAIGHIVNVQRRVQASDWDIVFPKPPGALLTHPSWLCISRSLAAEFGVRYPEIAYGAGDEFVLFDFCLRPIVPPPGAMPTCDSAPVDQARTDVVTA